jgi:hypothetical protein
MTRERNDGVYRGRKLFPDSREVIYDTGMANLPLEVQKVYLKGGYHSLVGSIIGGLTFVNNLSPEEQVFLRNRLARELVDRTADAYKDKAAVRSLLDYFDSRVDSEQYIKLSRTARRLAETYIDGK